MRITYLLLVLLLAPLLLVGCPDRSGRVGDDDDGEDDDDSAPDDDDGADDDDAADDDDGADDDDAVDDDDMGDDDDVVDDDDAVLDCPGTTLNCDAAAGGSTVGNNNGSSSWSDCGAGGDWTGGEEIFQFTPAASGSVTFELTWSDDTQDLDLFVLADCDAGAPCLGSSVGTTTLEEVDVTVTSGTPVYAVVDGYMGDAASFQLEVVCDGGGDDDDDDDDVGPDEPFIDITYCLDWNTVNVTDPAGLMWVLGLMGYDLSDYPVLLSSNGVNTSTNSIWMLGAAAVTGTCNQDTTYSPIDLTSTSPGTYVEPHWEVGPTTLTVPTPQFTLNVYDAVLTGDFTGTWDQIVNGTIEGEMEIPASMVSTACAWLSCYTCSSGAGDCVDFAADSAVYNDNGQGPLIP